MINTSNNKIPNLFAHLNIFSLSLKARFCQSKKKKKVIVVLIKNCNNGFSMFTLVSVDSSFFDPKTHVRLDYYFWDKLYIIMINTRNNRVVKLVCILSL